MYIQQTECVKQKLERKSRGDQAHMGWIQSLGMDTIPRDGYSTCIRMPDKFK